MTEYKVLTDIEHTLIRTKDSGVFERINQRYALNKDGLVYKTTKNHSPALLKIIDEPIENASDVALKGKVTDICVNYDSKTGKLIVYNNGKGIKHSIHKEGSKFLGRKIHTPELIFTVFRAGSKLGADGSDEGGCNGVGVKLTVVHSDNVNLQTVYKNKIYKQNYSMDLGKKELVVEPPVIEDYEGESFTQLEFLPHYERFGYTNQPTKDDTKEIIDIIRYRLLHLATFLSFKKVNITFNDERISVKNSLDLLNLIEQNEHAVKYPIIKTKGDKDKFIEYAVAVRSGKFVTTSTINGLVVLDGTHITHLTRAVNAKIKDLSKDKDKKIDCKNYMCIVSSSWLNVPNWGSQSKDRLEMKETDFKDFTFKDSVITKIAKDVLEKSKAIDLRKVVKQKIDKKLVYDKYTAAKKLNKGNNTLFIAEGDSAMLLLQRGLAMGNSSYTSDNTGLFSLGGVPSNIAKGITETQDEDGEDIEIASEKFYESKVFGALVQCLKVDPSKTYKTKEEMKTLTYQKVVICVDADLDGIGNIASLVLQMFFRLWPNLFKHNFIRIWNSPILRVTTKGGKLLKEFKFDQEFKEWEESGQMPKDAQVAYVKGLAGHSDKYIKGMFQQFERDLVNMTTGTHTKDEFEIFFGKDSTFRKEILSTPVVDFTKEEIDDMNDGSKSLLCDRHLRKNTQSFQIYAMHRTIPGLDNLTPVRRKALTSFYKHNVTSPLKIYMAAGRIAFEYLYHHGDASINGALIKMAQDYPGSNNISLLVKDGQVGSRNRRGKDAGSARYVGASLRKNTVEALFPKDDFPILPKSFTDGTEVEPQYYLPTLPLPILEFNKSVSYAWCLEVYPRDIDVVCKVLTKLCKGEEISDKDKKIPLSKKGFKGTLKFQNTEDGREQIYMKGLYKQLKEGKTDILHITELPLCVTPKKIELALIEDDDIVSNVSNHTTDDVDIKVELKSGWYDKVIKKYGSIEKFLHLEATIREHINFINEKGVIEHFDNAYDVLERCFQLNKSKYKQKIDRELLLLKYKILREQNIIRFIEVDEIEKLKRKTNEQIDNILSKDKFDKINSTALNVESKYTTDELVSLLENNKKYDYLMSIKVSDVSQVELNKRNSHLEEMLKRQKELEKMLKEKPFAGAGQYVSDIQKVYDVLK